MKKIEFVGLCLQLFAEGAGTGADGTGGTATAAVSQSTAERTENAAPNEGDKGVQAANAQEDGTEDIQAQYERDIKGKYKDLDDARIQNIVKNRLKQSKGVVDQFNALRPVLETLASRYNVDVNDIEALSKAVENDERALEEEALKRDMTVEQLKAFKKVEKERNDYRRQLNDQARAREEQARARQIQAWEAQAEEVKKVYPSFNLGAELQNPQFRALISNGVTVRGAYDALHAQEITAAAMQYTAKQVEEKVAAKVAENSKRVSENGLGTSAPTTTRKRPSELSAKERAEIARNVLRGKKYNFAE